MQNTMNEEHSACQNGSCQVSQQGHTAGRYLMKTKGLGHTTHNLQATGSAKQEFSKDYQYSPNSHIIYIRNIFAS